MFIAKLSGRCGISHIPTAPPHAEAFFHYQHLYQSGMFVTVDEPTLTIIIKQSLSFTRAFVLSVLHSMGLDKCNHDMSTITLFYCKKLFQCPKNPLCFPLFYCSC
jgi:hypothetical protein